MKYRFAKAACMRGILRIVRTPIARFFSPLPERSVIFIRTTT